MKLPGFQMPDEMEEAFILVETGWSPDVLEKQPVELIEAIFLYKQIKGIAVNGGEF